MSNEKDPLACHMSVFPKYSPPREEGWLRHQENFGEANLSAAAGVVIHTETLRLSDHPGRCRVHPSSRGGEYAYCTSSHRCATVEKSSVRVCRAIIRSSLVRITRTVQALPGPEMICACAVFLSASRPMPRYANPAQTSQRTAAAFSPIPPVKTSVSRPPSTAA